MNKVYRRADHNFFDELVTILASMHSLALAMQAYREKGLEYTDSDDSLTMESVPMDLDLKLTSLQMMDILAKNEWPDEIQFEEKPRRSEFPNAVKHEIELHGDKGVVGIILQGAFIRYFERRRPDVENNHGKLLSWPPVWKFGWVIRNSFTHGGGKISWKDNRITTVSWRGLTYNHPTDIGKQILFNDLAYAEIIYLMEEMDAAVTK